MRTIYVKPGMESVDVDLTTALLGVSLPVDNDGEHDGWGEAKPRQEDYEETEEGPTYGSIW